jgi:hypothetical protein
MKGWGMAHVVECLLANVRTRVQKTPVLRPLPKKNHLDEKVSKDTRFQKTNKQAEMLEMKSSTN